jgi:hypothetical protein
MRATSLAVDNAWWLKRGGETLREENTNKIVTNYMLLEENDEQIR